MVTIASREPSIDRISLHRLLTRTVDELTTMELEHLLSRVEEMDLELLQNIIAIHPTLSRHERVITALCNRVDSMNRRELGITLSRCPDLISSDRAVAAFHALIGSEVHGGLSPHSLAGEFAQRLGVDIYEALVARAYPGGKPSSDVARAFVLLLVTLRAPSSSAVAASGVGPDNGVALRVAKARQEAESARYRAELRRFSDEMRERAYKELPDADEVAAVDAPGRAAWNEKIRGELAERNSGALYYLRYPLRDALFDADTLAQLRSLVPRERLDVIIDTEDLRSVISQEHVAQQVLERHDERIWVERVPDWLEDTLIERTRRVRYEPELWELLTRLQAPGKDDKRRRLLDVLVELARAGSERHVYRMAAKLLFGNHTLWKSKAHGQALILAALRRRQFYLLRDLVIGPPSNRIRWSDDIQAELNPQVKVMHYAFGCALLTWGEETLAGDPEGLERLLGAIGLLDPPRYFAKDVHCFTGRVRLTENAHHLAEHIRRVAKSQGGSDAHVYALFQCIEELEKTTGE